MNCWGDSGWFFHVVCLGPNPGNGAPKGPPLWLEAGISKRDTVGYILQLDRDALVGA